MSGAGGTRGAVRRGWLRLLKHTLNRITVPAARAGRGPFALVRHTGRKTGRVYETPLILARHGRDFVAELTYGPEVAWYRNVVAAGHCTVLVKGVAYEVTGIEPCSVDVGLRAFGQPAATVLRLLHRREFRLLRVA